MAKEIRSKQLVRFLMRLGFYKLFQKGSHLRLAHSDGRKVTIAIHNKPISKGTLSVILKQANLSKKDLGKL